MRVSQHEKALSRERIVTSAARLVREHGIESTSVNDVMKAAAMTHGGFYRHFGSKEKLVEAALGAGFDEMLAMLDDGPAPNGVLARFETFYLSADHAATPGSGCPIPSTAADVGRGSTELKAAFGAGINRVIDRLAKGLDGDDGDRRAEATRHLAMMAGAIVIARASDPATATAVLEACRDL